MRILLTGSNGQLGTEFRTISRSTAEVISTGSRELDLTNEQEIRRFVREVKPDVIVNAAAFSDVDAAERNWDACFALNAIAPVILAEEAHRLDSLLIHYSTDQVFDGSKSEPYSETDPTSPLNVYGASKAGRRGRNCCKLCAFADSPPGMDLRRAGREFSAFDSSSGNT